jgi:ketosteroid isomerase-like protein
MTSANVDLVRRVFDEYPRGSFAAAAEFTHPDFEMRLQTSHPLAATFRGPRHATKAMADWMESFEGFNGEPEQFIDAGGDRVVVAFRERGRPRRGSVDLDHRFGILYTLREGKIARMEWFDSTEEALAVVSAPGW